jgi:4'-phosphopantetheinyl transferase
METGMRRVAVMLLRWIKQRPADCNFYHEGVFYLYLPACAINFLERMKPHRREHLAGHMIVWIAQVSKARDSLVFLEPCLDGRDRERAARFRFSEDRARFVLGRGLLRKCLGHYLNQTPETIELAATDRGRPILPHDEAVQFSISHTHDLVAVALTADARVGIDLERVQPHLDLPELAKRIFSEEDLQTFQALPGHEAPAAFFRAWTRKEAYLKARGEGIAEGLRQISVSLGPEEICGIKDARSVYGAQAWRLHALPVPEDYMGCLACDHVDKQLECNFVHFNTNEITL